MSSRPDFIPKEYVERFNTVQDCVPPWPFDEIKNLVDHSLQNVHGLSFEEVFDSFDASPLGSASIGQVHAATLNNEYTEKATGGRYSKVAVKVMHRDAEDRFRNDFKIFKWLCRVALPGWTPILVELERQMMTEFNYMNETSNLRVVRENMARSPYRKLVTVPEPVDRLCTSNVLVMELLHGDKLAKAAEDQLANILDGDHRLARKIMEEKREDLFHGTGETKSRLEELQSIISRSEEKSLPKRFYKACQLISLGRKQKKNLDLLLDIHGYQIFVNGCFNGDPHPGNILELEDGKLGLIDYGQFKILNDFDRLSIAKIVCELGSSEKIVDKNVADAMRDFGFKFRYNKDDTIRQTAVLFFDSDRAGKMMGFATPQMYLMHLQSQNPFDHVPDAAVFVARTSFLFRGMGALLGEQICTSRRWSRHAKIVIDQELNLGQKKIGRKII